MLNILPDILKEYRNLITKPTNLWDSSSSDSSGSELFSKEEKKKVDLNPSGFVQGCICGHDIEIRDIIYDNRKRRNMRCPGVTIKPKTSPVRLNLRDT